MQAEDIWAALKASRKAPRWHRSSWAAQFGFSSYGKFFRACILAFGATPHEIEIALIDEILAEDEQNRELDKAENQNRDRQGAPETVSAVKEVVKRE